MADHEFGKPVVDDPYADDPDAVLTQIQNAIDSLAKMLDGTNDTNVPDDAYRINSGQGYRIEQRSGSNWVARTLKLGLLTSGLVDLTASEVEQLKKINSKTISNDQWGWLGALGSQPMEHDNFASARMVFQMTTPPTGWTKVTSGVSQNALRVVEGSVGSGGSMNFTSAFASSRGTNSKSPGTSSSSPGTNSAGSHDHGGSTGSSSPGTNTTGSHDHGGNTAGHTLSISRIPSHDHGLLRRVGGDGSNNWTSSFTGSDNNPIDNTDGTSRTTGGGNSHSHSISDDGGHSHTVNSHSHSIGDDGGHSHTVDSHSHTVNSHNHTLSLDVKYTDVILADWTG